mgnify:CR=1 FL=1
MNKVVVTGSRGLIGRSLCRRLADLGCEVIEFDCGIAPDASGFGNVLDPANCHRAIAQADGVFHLAAVSRVIWGERDPQLCMAVNTVGTANILAACQAAPQPPWIAVASSREVYGQALQLPVAEHAPKQPPNVYARSKCHAEQAVEHAARQGLRAGFVRLSSVYGDAFDHATRVVPAFVTAALGGQPLNVEGAEGVLDFTHAEDVARGLVMLGHSIAKGAWHGPLHFVSGQPTSLLDLAKIIIRLTDSRSTVHVVAARTYDVSQFVGNPAKALRELGWQNETPLEDGVAKLIAEYRTIPARNRLRPSGQSLTRCGARGKQPA